VTDLARAMDPHIELQEVGIREGEKLHEFMITKKIPGHLSIMEIIILFILKFTGGMKITISLPAGKKWR